MHIGFLQAYFSRSSIGGGEHHTERLARALEQRGHEVTIFTDAPNERRKGIDDLDVREYPTPAKLNPINELSLAQRAFEDMQACDVVTLSDDSAWRGVDLPVPTAMVFHIVWHGWVERHRPITRILREKPQALLYRHMERKICRKADAIVSISPNVRDDILLVGTVEDKLIDIPNGVDIERFSPVEDSYNEFTVHFQGRLVEMKNPGLLVEAAYSSEENWRLLIGGDGPLREKLEARVGEYGLEDRVEFIGYVPDKELPERYARADVFALPSDYEGMPLTVLEAAASGTAILASPRAATDFVTDEMGVVVDPDADAIAGALDELARDPDRVARMGKAARDRVEDYSWAAIAEQYESLYEDLTE
ncbi:MAG: glycosyltransferase family 4 protein [Halobacteriales archaeon]